ncbi:RING-CH-type domain-containing protein, partial [Podarcis lilfordi]
PTLTGPSVQVDRGGGRSLHTVISQNAVLLSSVTQTANTAGSDGPICRICHRRKRRRPALALRLHGHLGDRPQELPGEVAFLLQHELLRTVPHRVCRGAAAQAPDRVAEGPRPTQRNGRCSATCTFYHLCPLDTGFIPLPLPAVLRVAKDQSESPPDDPGLEEPAPCLALAALRQAPEEEGRRDDRPFFYVVPTNVPARDAERPPAHCCCFDTPPPPLCRFHPVEHLLWRFLTAARLLLRSNRCGCRISGKARESM